LQIRLVTIVNELTSLGDSISTSKGVYAFNTNGLYDRYTITEQLDPWGGYFIYANESCELKIAPREANSLPKSSSSSYMDNLAKSETDWVLQLRAFSAQSGDDFNFIGCLRDAREDDDENELMEPPFAPEGRLFILLVIQYCHKP